MCNKVCDTLCRQLDPAEIFYGEMSCLLPVSELPALHWLKALRALSHWSVKKKRGKNTYAFLMHLFSGYHAPVKHGQLTLKAHQNA